MLISEAYTEIVMSRCKTLIVALGIMVSASAGAAEPGKSGAPAGGAKVASRTATALPASEALAVGTAALLGTAIGLSDSAEATPSTATATSTSATSPSGTAQ